MTEAKKPEAHPAHPQHPAPSKPLKAIDTTGKESPSIGRIVHYVDPETGKHQPAIIANIEDGYLDLYRIDANLSVNRIADPKAALGTWHWPEPTPESEE